MQAEEIHVLNHKVRLLQPPQPAFRTSMDSVMLAAACKASLSDHILDMGCGVGSAGLCALYRLQKAKLTGVDFEKTYIELAEQNAGLNNVTDRAEFILADVRNFTAPQLYDHVIFNPPYYEAGAHTPSPHAIKAKANGHTEDELTLDDWVKAAHRLVRSRGTMTVIYPAGGMQKILAAMGRKFGATEIIPLWPKAGEEARRIIIRCVKDRQPSISLLKGLILHNEDGSATQEANAVLKDGAAI